MKLEMLEEQLLLDPDKKRDKTDGGIIIPEAANARAPLRRGCVIAHGNGRMLECGNRTPMRSAVGDVIWYPPTKACYVSIDGKSYVVVDESCCVGLERPGDMPEPNWAKGAHEILDTGTPSDPIDALVSDIERHGPAARA